MNILIYLILILLQGSTELIIGSPAFESKGFIPAKYTCQGENVNPAITIKNVPERTKSLAIIMFDPEALGGTFDHWIIWNIVPMRLINEHSSPGKEGKNGFGTSSYIGPCPPNGTHRYIFSVYALVMHCLI